MLENAEAPKGFCVSCCIAVSTVHRRQRVSFFALVLGPAFALARLLEFISPLAWQRDRSDARVHQFWVAFGAMARLPGGCPPCRRGVRESRPLLERALAVGGTPSGPGVGHHSGAAPCFRDRPVVRLLRGDAVRFLERGLCLLGLWVSVRVLSFLARPLCSIGFARR